MRAAEVCRHRLSAQFLLTRGPPRARDVVRALGAVQAQDYAGAKWALSLRARNRSDATIEAELDAGHILRTHVMRPTWHFVSPEDIRWLLALTSPRVKALMASYNRRLELTPAVFRRSHGVIARALADGRHLTRPELKERLEAARIGTVPPQRLAHLMMEAELDAVVCSGPRRGTRFTYALLDERAPPVPVLDRDESLHRLARCYFETRGPASAHDFAWWSGLTVADAKRAIQTLGKAVDEVTIDGRPCWLRAGARAAPMKGVVVHLLPNYDEYFIGYKDRSAIGQRFGSVSSVTGGSALIAHVVAVNGQLVGGWRRADAGGETILDLDIPLRVTRAERAGIAVQVKRFGDFVGVAARARIA